MLSQFIETLKHFVHREADEQKKQILSMWSESVETRVSEGEAITDLVPVSITFNRATFQLERNLSKFRNGDELRLNLGNPFLRPHVGCTLESERANTLTVIAGYQEIFEDLRNKIWTLDRQHVDVRHLLLGALEELEFNAPKLRQFQNYIQGKVVPDIHDGEYENACERAALIGLDASQTEAFAKAVASRDFYLIQGPPGTGKTSVLAHIAAQLAWRGQRVLVTAFTHTAINNALRKIAEKTDFANVYKIGQSHNAGVDELGSVQNFEYFEHVKSSSQSGGFIVGGTCFAARSKRLRDVRFDTVIFDEAGQITLPVAFAGMLCYQAKNTYLLATISKCHQ